MLNASDHIGVRELARRRSAGIDVTLLWKPSTDCVFVDVADDVNGDAFRIVVSATDALDAFNHPYAYQTEFARPTQTKGRGSRW